MSSSEGLAGLLLRTTTESSRAQAVYPLAAVQFFLGTFIAAVNILALAATAGNKKLRSGQHLLLANLWFANLLLGAIVAVANVGDKPDRVALQKPEGTISVVNSLATLATFLALFTSRLVKTRDSHHQMAFRSAIKVLAVIWSGIFFLVLVKTIVFTLDSLGKDNVCYQCLLGFEAALLLIFAVITVMGFAIVMYTNCVHLKSSVTDSASVPRMNDQAAEYRETLTLGILLGVFVLPFICLIATLLTHTVYSDLDEVATEAILTLFYFHCLINPLIFILRHKEVRATAARILRCQRINAPETHDDIQTPVFRPVSGPQGGATVTPPASAVTSGQAASPSGPPAYSARPYPTQNPAPSAPEPHSQSAPDIVPASERLASSTSLAKAPEEEATTPRAESGFRQPTAGQPHSAVSFAPEGGAGEEPQTNEGTQSTLVYQPAEQPQNSEWMNPAV